MSTETADAFGLPDGLYKFAYPDTGAAYSLDLIEANEAVDAVLDRHRRKLLAAQEVCDGDPAAEKPGNYAWVYEFRAWLYDKLGAEFRPGFVREVLHGVQVANLEQKKRHDAQLSATLTSPSSTDSTPEIPAA